MPILPLEPYVNPEDLFAQPADAATGKWWVFHTKPRAEKALARRLLQFGAAFFLPLRRKSWRRRGRNVTSVSPLFPGYIFLLGDENARLKALGTNLIVQTLVVEDQPLLWADLSRVHQLMASGAMLAAENKFLPGTAVVIASGPLAGLEGKIIRKGKRLRLVIEVHFLHRGASVEIEEGMLEPKV
jgi:transcriptional antiterminator RfaH